MIVCCCNAIRETEVRDAARTRAIIEEERAVLASNPGRQAA
jgi:bacterioferritin-associated ferredoxin